MQSWAMASPTVAQTHESVSVNTVKVFPSRSHSSNISCNVSGRAYAADHGYAIRSHYWSMNVMASSPHILGFGFVRSSLLGAALGGHEAQVAERRFTAGNLKAFQVGDPAAYQSCLLGSLR